MKKLHLFLILVLCLAPLGVAQTPAVPAPATPGAAPSPAPMAIMNTDLNAIPAPDAKARGNGDPDGSLTGNVTDVPVADPITDKTPKAKGLTIGDMANQIGQNKVAINFVWT